MDDLDATERGTAKRDRTARLMRVAPTRNKRGIILWPTQTPGNPKRYQLPSRVSDATQSRVPSKNNEVTRKKIRSCKIRREMRASVPISKFA